MPDQVVSGSTGESLLRAGVRSGIGMAGLGAGRMATNAGLGFSGGVVGEMAATLAPDERQRPEFLTPCPYKGRFLTNRLVFIALCRRILHVMQHPL